MNKDDLLWAYCPHVVSTPDVVGGAYRFEGTRLPIYCLINHLDGGSTVDEFMEWFANPSVPRAVVDEVVKFYERHGEIRLKTSDIPTLPVLLFLERLAKGEIDHSYEGVDLLENGMAGPCTVTWQPSMGCSSGEQSYWVGHGMPEGTNRKLALSKMQRLIDQGLASGCCCGCRGDFQLTDKGRQFIKDSKTEKEPITKEWFESMAHLEDGMSIEAGMPESVTTYLSSMKKQSQAQRDLHSAIDTIEVDATKPLILFSIGADGLPSVFVSGDSRSLVAAIHYVLGVVLKQDMPEGRTEAPDASLN